jgi:rod shape-determining protein MreD
MTPVRKVLRAVAIPLFLVLAVIGQLTVVNRAPLPGGGKPDLVLLVVTALAVTTGPMTGMLAGFAGGLALDIAPPGGHLAGEYALIFCLVGYACGRIMTAVEEATGERPTVTALTVMAAGAVAGEAGKAVLGKMVSDPTVSVAAIRHVLPRAVVYDLLLCAFVLWLVSAAVRRPAPERAPRPEFSQARQLTTAFRLASAGAVPSLRLAGSTAPLTPPPVRAEPRLRLSGARSPALSRTNVAFSPGRTALPGGRTAKLNFASTGASALRTPQRLPGKAPGKGWLRPEKAVGTAAPRRGAPPKGWLRGDRTAAVPTVPQRRSPGKGWLRAAPTVASATAIRRTSPPKGWLRAERLVAASAPRRKSPGKGWLRPVKPAPAPRLKSPGKGWLRPAKPAPAPRRRSPGKGWLRPARPPKSNWYTRGPSGRWLRHDRGLWRSPRRLLQLVGGRR